MTLSKQQIVARHFHPGGCKCTPCREWWAADLAQVRSDEGDARVELELYERGEL